MVSRFLCGVRALRGLRVREVAEAQFQQADACRSRPDQSTAAQIHRVLHVRTPFFRTVFLSESFGLASLTQGKMTDRRFKASMCKD
jgi:hypothetical protein